MPSSVTLSQFCHERRQDAKRLYLWTRQKHMQFLYVKIEVVEREITSVTLEQFQLWKSILFLQRKIFSEKLSIHILLEFF